MKIKNIVIISIVAFILCGCQNNNVSVSEKFEELQEKVEETDVIKYYTLATTLTKEQVENDGFGNYSYNGIKFLYSDCDSIEKEDIVKPGAFYRKMAEKMDRFMMVGEYDSDYEEYISSILGYVPNEFRDYKYANLTLYITTSSNPQNRIMEEIESLDCSFGNFDYENENYEFVITDLQKCAAEMGISEEMLGYTLAMLDEYQPEVKFGGKAYSFKTNEDFVFEESEKNDYDYLSHCCVEGCNKIAHESLTGFSGKLEWYCTEHYNEMIEIVDHMLNGN